MPSAFVNICRTAVFWSRLAIKENLKNPFKKLTQVQSSPIYVLANGPSLKMSITELCSIQEGEFMVVNDFANDDSFIRIKPKYYVLSDPLFFEDTIYTERGKKVINSIKEKANWPIMLFVPYCRKKSSYLSQLCENKNISIQWFHQVGYLGIERWRNYVYKMGLGNGEFMTVALNAMYIALMLGYKKCFFYGIDHNFFENIAVSHDNTLCFIDKHFYSETDQLKPMICHFPDKGVHNYSMEEFLQEKYIIFKGHNIMRRFADYMGATIVNCTPNSLVDSYLRE